MVGAFQDTVYIFIYTECSL